MAKSKAEQHALQVVRWLLEQAEFEQNGIEEASLASAVGLSEQDAREAVDRLENHEEVVRVPKALTSPPQFILKPGRGWRDVKTHALPQSANG